MLSTRRWLKIHFYSSVICTLFLLILCISGLPLIFSDEINDWLGYQHNNQKVASSSLDDIAKTGRTALPDKKIQFVVWEPNKQGVITLSMGETSSSHPSTNEAVYVDANTAKQLDESVSGSAFLEFMLQVHTTLLVGPVGTYFLGLIGVIFTVCVISGVVVYFPYMRLRKFGDIRRNKGSQAKQLDLHKLVGICLAMWMFVIATTGAINGWGMIIFQIWRHGELAQATAVYDDPKLYSETISLDHVLNTAQNAAPEAIPYIIALPGSMMTSEHHYGVFMRGKTPSTKYKMTPIMVDAASGRLTSKVEPPWFIKGLVLSQPLHFGDYGGLSLKAAWAILDILMIFLLINSIIIFKNRYIKKQ